MDDVRGGVRGSVKGSARRRLAVSGGAAFYNSVSDNENG